ncbi:hypothetical protein XI09_03920 [Bradyrhizobium sp. CCBAU 11386]|nr:hypothetical protein [Bradyrhizobium sp. CCBAU 11386]
MARSYAPRLIFAQNRKAITSVGDGVVIVRRLEVLPQRSGLPAGWRLSIFTLEWVDWFNH